jgi:putative phage-type endonuclease
MKCKPIIGPESYTDEWFEKRRESIGASEASAVCGMSRWAQPLTVYQRKVDGGEQRREMTEEQRMGHRLEAGILEEYDSRFGGLVIYKVPMLIHEKHKFISATPDAIAVSSGQPVSYRSRVDVNDGDFSSYKMEEVFWSSDVVSVDAKTSRKSSDWGQEGTDDIPVEYIMQAQQQMAVINAERCDIPCLHSGSLKVKVYCVSRNDDIISEIIKASREMMERIENRDPPEANWAHSGTLDLMKAMYDVKESTKEMGYSAISLWDEMEVMKSKRIAIDKRIKENKSRILEEMGDSAIGELPDGRQLRRKMVQRKGATIPGYKYMNLTCKKKESDDERKENS